MNTPGATHPYFIRLGVDFDPAGNPIGYAVEQWSNGERQAVLVCGTPGPFDTPEEAFEMALVDYEHFVGLLKTLW